MGFQSPHNGEFESVSKYILFCFDKKISPHFKGFKPYQQMFEKGILLPRMQFIRTFYNNRGEDGFYEIIKEGKLKGIYLPYHSGRPGIHNPQELLDEENSPDGWEIDGPLNLSLLEKNLI